MKIPTNIQFWVDKIKNREKFSLARYGDGELYCMWGKKGKNSNGCDYSPELKEALLDSFRHQDDPSFYYGLQRVLPQDEYTAMERYPNVVWHETECFSEAVAGGKLYPLIEELRKIKNLIIVGNEDIFTAVTGIFPVQPEEPGVFIQVERKNAYNSRLRILTEIINYSDKDTVVLFSCGMAANALIGELHDICPATLIDVGHIWDPFAGIMSRCDLDGKTREDILKNLQPCDD